MMCPECKKSDVGLCEFTVRVGRGIAVLYFCRDCRSRYLDINRKEPYYKKIALEIRCKQNNYLPKSLFSKRLKIMA